MNRQGHLEKGPRGKTSGGTEKQNMNGQGIRFRIADGYKGKISGEQ